MQRQSCDLVAAINAILDVQPAAEHVMMMEDDWLFCPHGLDSLRYFLSKAYQYDPRWLAQMWHREAGGTFCEDDRDLF